MKHNNTNIIKALRILVKDGNQQKIEIGITLLLSQNPTKNQLHQAWKITEDARICEALDWNVSQE